MLQKKILHHKYWIFSEKSCLSKLFGFASTNRFKLPERRIHLNMRQTSPGFQKQLALHQNWAALRPLIMKIKPRESMPNKNMHMLQIKPVKAHAISLWSTNSVLRTPLSWGRHTGEQCFASLVVLSSRCRQTTSLAMTVRMVKDTLQNGNYN